MHTRLLFLLLTTTFLLSGPAWSHPGHHKKAITLKLKKFRRAGIFHKRLAGQWKLSLPLSKHLHKTFRTPKVRALSLTIDTKALGKIPAPIRPLLQKNILIVAGWMKIFTKKQAIPYKIPFVVTLFNGEVQLLFFLHRGKSKYSNPESFQVMLVTSRDKKRDVLFVGRDLGIGNMAAFRRVTTLP